MYTRKKFQRTSATRRFRGGTTRIGWFGKKKVAPAPTAARARAPAAAVAPAAAATRAPIPAADAPIPAAESLTKIQNAIAPLFIGDLTLKQTIDSNSKVLLNLKNAINSIENKSTFVDNTDLTSIENVALKNLADICIDNKQKKTSYASSMLDIITELSTQLKTIL